MIFVTVGNGLQPFGRLLEAVDAAAARGVFGDEEVLVQRGNHPAFASTSCAVEDFIPMDRFVGLVRDASLVICHAGAGTLLHVLAAGKVPVVMPRRPRHGEIVDDHQVELVRALADIDRVVVAWEPDDLAAAVEAARHRSPVVPGAAPSRLASLVAEAITALIGDPD